MEVIEQRSDRIAHLSKLFSKFIAGGRLAPLFKTVMYEARVNLSEDDEAYDSLAQQRYVINVTIGETKQALSVVVKQYIRCCGQSLEVRGGYDKRTDQHSLLLRCNNCGCRLEIDEQGKCGYTKGNNKIEGMVDFYAGN